MGIMESDGEEFPTDERYYDKYEHSTSNTTFNRGILGDATKEMGPFQSLQYKTQLRNISSWYNDEAWFVIPGLAWLHRGGVNHNGTGAGLFAFAHVSGEVMNLLVFVSF